MGCRIKYKNIINVLLLLMLFISSLKTLLPFKTNFFDEIFIILILMVTLFFRRKLTVDLDVKIAFAYLLLSFVVGMVNKVSIFAYISDIYSNMKLIFVFIVFSQFYISDKDKEYIFRGFILINIPSIIFSLYQYYNRDSGWRIGLKMRGGVGRIEGATGHPIWFGFVLVSIIIILIELDIFRIKETKRFFSFRLICLILCIGLCLFLLKATQSRYPIAIFGMVLIFWILRKFKKSSRFSIILVVAFCAMIFLFSSEQLISGFISEEGSSVRMKGILCIPKALLNYPLGSGIGTFGGEASVVYNSSVYDTFGLEMPSLYSAFNQGNYYESTFVQRFVEMGIIGATLYFLVFARALKYYKYCNDKSSWLILLIFVFNAIINVGYQLPLIILAGISYSNLKYSYKERENLT